MPKINFFQMCNKRGLTAALKDLNFLDVAFEIQVDADEKHLSNK